MLMAAALLISTSTWAQISVYDFGDLQDAFKTAPSGSTITLAQNIQLEPNDVLWLGTECVDDDARSLTLNLNGKKIYRQGTSTAATYHFFVVSHGELKVTGTGTIGFEGTGKSTASSTIFSVFGSYKPENESNALINGLFTHVEIGENVTLNMPLGYLGTAIAVDVVNRTTTGDLKANSVARWAASTVSSSLNYNTTFISHATYGYAYGAQVDVKGKIYSLGGADGTNEKSYGIKTNGNLESPLAGYGLTQSYLTGFSCNVNDSWFNNYNAETRKADVAYVPFVHVFEKCTIQTASGSTRSAAIYASGYAKWLIEGECSGNIGVSVSSGDITLNGADIQSTASTYTPPTATGGVTGSGSGIVVNSRDNYAGNVDITITGGTEISATAGYAIEEKINTDDKGNKVDEITIESAAITGGGEGAIIMTSTTVEETSIINATVDGTINTTNADGTNKQDQTASENLGGLVKGTTTDPNDTEHYYEDADYQMVVIPANPTDPVNPTTTPTITVEPNLSKVITMNAYGYSTFSAVNKNRVIKAADSEELKVYIAESVDNQQGVLNLAACNGGLIPQNTGVIFIGQPGKTYILDTPTGTVAAVSNPLLQPASAWTTTAEEGGIYTATADEMAAKASQHLYVLAGNELLKYTGNQMKANKAYLKLSAAGPYGAPKRVQMVVTETEETQAVENVETTIETVKFMENGQIFIRRGENIYNVQGQIVK